MLQYQNNIDYCAEDLKLLTYDMYTPNFIFFKKFDVSSME